MRTSGDPCLCARACVCVCACIVFPPIAAARVIAPQQLHGRRIGRLRRALAPPPLSSFAAADATAPVTTAIVAAAATPPGLCDVTSPRDPVGQGSALRAVGPLGPRQ